MSLSQILQICIVTHMLIAAEHKNLGYCVLNENIVYFGPI